LPSGKPSHVNATYTVNSLITHTPTNSYSHISHSLNQRIHQNCSLRTHKIFSRRKGIPQIASKRKCSVDEGLGKPDQPPVSCSQGYNHSSDPESMSTYCMRGAFTAPRSHPQSGMVYFWRLPSTVQQDHDTYDGSGSPLSRL
jgi:hypothetical protein